MANSRAQTSDHDPQEILIERLGVSPATPVSRISRALAWAVHLYTASGAVFALLAVLAGVKGELVQALWLLLAALVVDGTDGLFARRFRVAETIPDFDGARLDDIVDYLTYVFAPMVLLLTAGRLPHGIAGGVIAALPLAASCIQFCRTNAKTEDHYFLGFPSYWNVVAFYAVALDLSPTSVSVVILTCSVLVFVPVKYLYPSRTSVLRNLNLGLAGMWLVLVAVVLATMPTPSRIAVACSLAYIAYYVIFSVVLTVSPRIRQRLQHDRSAPGPTAAADELTPVPTDRVDGEQTNAR